MALLLESILKSNVNTGFTVEIKTISVGLTEIKKLQLIFFLYFYHMENIVLHQLLCHSEYGM